MTIDRSREVHHGGEPGIAVVVGDLVNDVLGIRGSQHAPGQIQYSGTVKYVTKSGVLRAEENGIWDSKTKDYAGLVTISGGTGDFEGATGKLAAFGNSRGAGMVIGTICK